MAEETARFINQGTLTERERLNAIVLLIKIGCFVTKGKYSFSVKNS
jgi:hypothetical protein